MAEYIKNEEGEGRLQLPEDNDLDQDEGDFSDLQMDSADTKVWLVKVPKFLADKWNAIDADGLELGSVRIHEAQNGQDAKISVILPDDELTADLPKEYNLTVQNKEVRNTMIFSEQQRGEKRKAMALAGTVHHECNVMPVYNDSYRALMRQRNKVAAEPIRKVQVISSGSSLLRPGTVGSSTSVRGGPMFNDFLTRKPQKGPSGEIYKAARMPRNELLDILFNNFENYPYWSLKGLREQTKQPEQYLKEVLSDIAILNKKGPYNAMYELKPEYKKAKGTSSMRPVVPETSRGNSDDDNDDIDDDGDDEDEDMEVVNVD